MQNSKKPSAHIEWTDAAINRGKFLQMIKFLLLGLIFSALSPTLALGQDSLTFAHACFRDRCVLLDTNGKVLLLSPQYYHGDYYRTGNFQEGMAITHQGGKYGFYNLEGKQVVRNIFRRLRNFKNGFAAVQFQGRWGWINRQGKFLGDPQYDQVGDFDAEGLAGARLGDMIAFVDTAGKIAIPFRYHCIEPLQGDDYIPSFSDGLAPVIELDTIGYRVVEKLGYINRTGELVIPCVYGWEIRSDDQRSRYPRGFWGGRVKVLKGNTSMFLDALGNELTKGDLEIRTFSGFQYSKVNGFEKVVNSRGQTITEGKYEAVWNFSEGLAPAYLGEDDQNRSVYEYIDTTGKVMFDKQFFRVYNHFQDGLALVWEFDKGWGFIDTTGNYVIPPGMATEQEFLNGYTSYVVYKREYSRWKYGAMDKKGNIVVKARFHEPLTFTFGRAVVVKKGYGWGRYGQKQQSRVGIVDARGKMVVPLNRHFGASLYDRQPLN